MSGVRCQVFFLLQNFWQKAWVKKSRPAQRPAAVAASTSRAAISIVWNIVGKAPGNQGGCVVSTENRNTAPTREASRVKNPTSKQTPTPVTMQVTAKLSQTIRFSFGLANTDSAPDKTDSSRTDLSAPPSCEETI